MAGDMVITAIRTIWPFAAWGICIGSVYLIMHFKREGICTQLWRLPVLYIIAIWFLAIGIVQLDPLQRTENVVRNNILRSTPIGMCRHNVQHIVDTTHGRVLGSPLGATRNFVPSDGSLCSQSTPRGFWSDLGRISYFLIFGANVRAYWTFDECGKLVEVRVMRYLDL